MEINRRASHLRRHLPSRLYIVNGNQAFGSGYSDPSGIGGNFTRGMLSNLQYDQAGLAFNVGTNDFPNLFLDISSIDLSVFSGPFVPPSGLAPVFQFTLFDNPSGATGLGSGTVPGSLRATGTVSDRSEFDWTNLVLPLADLGNTNGNVILQIDLLIGGYAALDNFLIEASEKLAVIPVPAAIWLFGTALIGLVGFCKRRKSV